MPYTAFTVEARTARLSSLSGFGVSALGLAAVASLASAGLLLEAAPGRLGIGGLSFGLRFCGYGKCGCGCRFRWAVPLAWLRPSLRRCGRFGGGRGFAGLCRWLSLRLGFCPAARRVRLRRRFRRALPRTSLPLARLPLPAFDSPADFSCSLFSILFRQSRGAAGAGAPCWVLSPSANARVSEKPIGSRKERSNATAGFSSLPRSNGHFAINEVLSLRSRSLPPFLPVEGDFVNYVLQDNSGVRRAACSAWHF